MSAGLACDDRRDFSLRLTRMAARRSSFVSNLLRRRYWALALALALVVWLGVALAMRPLREESGGYERAPYGLTTSLENRALDLLFQLRDARHTELRERGLKEPITIIDAHEEHRRASHVRLQNRPRNE